ncbi:MAG: hypothetical protein L0K86_03305 [Actinomycetia bacterium]|nr:hypothetical protein [Actinomycetes bacterium]
MRRIARILFLGGVLALMSSAFTAMPATGKTERSLVTVCAAFTTNQRLEHTVHVPEVAADFLLKQTATYRGPCAEYGESADRGNGRMTAYTQAQGRVPKSVGIVMTAETLDGLPHDPPTDGKWCFDKNGDGTVDPMMECSNGYSDQLRFGKRFTRTVDTPLKYALVDWNTHGHGPPGVYDRPHFDMHFYLQANAERMKIRPGPCPELVNCDDYELGKKLPAPKYRPADFEYADAQSPGMGNHLIDMTGPEFHGEPFTHTFIYGTWNRDVTFYEPMITHDWLAGLVDGSRESGCFPIKAPAAYQRSGWYATQYCMRYRDNRDDLTISLEDFVHRTAS